MSLRIAAGLLKATRFARRGKLLKATAALQHVLRGINARAARSGTRMLKVAARAAGSTRKPPGKASNIHELATASMVPAPSRQGRFVAASFTNDAGTRDYKVYIPALYQGGALPLVVMLHGCKQDPDSFAAGTGMNELADECGFVVVYPMQAGRANVSHCWNWFQTQDQARDQGEPSLIAGITRDVVEEYGLDSRRVYVAGLSAGGAMAAIMGTTYPDVYAAVGIHSGLAYAVACDVSSAFAAMRGDGAGRALQASLDNAALRTVPTIVFHGDDDRTVHPSNGEQLIAQAAPQPTEDAGVGASAEDVAVVEKGDARGRAYTRTLYRDVRGKSVTEHWLVHGAGHAWSGGSPAGSYTDPTGPVASREMVRFFLQQS